MSDSSGQDCGTDEAEIYRLKALSSLCLPRPVPCFATNPSVQQEDVFLGLTPWWSDPSDPNFALLSLRSAVNPSALWHLSLFIDVC